MTEECTNKKHTLIILQLCQLSRAWHDPQHSRRIITEILTQGKWPPTSNVQRIKHL